MEERSSATDPRDADGAQGKQRPVLRRNVDENGKRVVTPEMLELAEALAHPEGDPYENGRRLGFYCETCG